MIYGHERPRIVTPEQVELTPETTLGFDCIAFALHVLGVTLNPWQEYFIKRALEILPDGRFRYRTVILLVARQNGKSLVMTVVALYMMIVSAPGELVLGTAQDLDTSEGTWSDAVDMVEDVPALERKIDTVVKTNGEKALVLKKQIKRLSGAIPARRAPITSRVTAARGWRLESSALSA
jgi:phage terminase large subunit-like protein